MYLITGAGGQLGRELCALLAAQEEPFVAYGRAQLDIADSGAVRQALEQSGAAVLFNCAAYTRVDKAESEAEEAHRVNATGAKVLAEACSAAGSRLVHISTDYVFDGSACRPYPEDAPTQPLGVYGQSKLNGEVAVLEGGREHLVVRTAWVYGSGGPNFVRTILRLAGEREQLRVVADQVGSPTWTFDLAAALVGLVKARAEGGIYHVTNSGVTSWYDFAVAIAEEAQALGRALQLQSVVPITTAEYPTPAARPAYSVLSNARAIRVLGSPLPQWRQSLRRMLQQLDKEG
ncbi:dTDP-4-dehydrorhamnose reductase [Gloeobacter morelensis]|uniref:dTDP-4-dehydrorhamnose reductase n=1 Tax=Gloeobacter morelensis MG652769 TaxID=2781736 RepID=A0ABY3PN21_9CYAN|nr:dTDP-4-dehydrorhamnose reductase [Gloeobacter morelensis]UFP95093.1 dTDP-4-dehydrorhamnose reductase [Gloeobacter morelensis MG652769]